MLLIMISWGWSIDYTKFEDMEVIVVFMALVAFINSMMVMVSEIESNE